jgi:hypothetical protein
MAVLEELACAMFTCLLLVWATATRPTSAECFGKTWYMSHGIREDGRYQCSRPPIGGDTDVLTGRNTAIDQPGVIYGTIYCTGGMRPIVVNYRSVGCMRRSGS